MNYIIVFVAGVLRDSLDKILGRGRKPQKKGYVPILHDFADFFTRRFYHRIDDCFARVVTSNAGAFMDVCVSKKTNDFNQITYFERDSKNMIVTRRTMNLGSYNYLGFGDPDDYCTPAVLKVLKQYGPATSSVRVTGGTTQVHKDLEKIISDFLGTEDAITFGMGWATNAAVIPAVVSKGDLIISDHLNHNSIITGARASGATVRVMRHNNMNNLERLLVEAIINGQPRTRRPWGKILVIVEGIYSMEGEICRLKELVELKRRYKFYIWLDEAHSIGAMGASGRGVCEHCGVSTSEIDFMMGTFTKSFGAAGGYIAGSKKLIEWLRVHSFANIYADAMPAPVAQQALSVFEAMQLEFGKKRIKNLHDNARWFRSQLIERKFKILGEDDSPVVPIIIPPFSFFTQASRRAFELGLGIVVVSFPAVDILEGRIRICINAIHTRDDLQRAIDILEDCVKDIPAKIE